VRHFALLPLLALASCVVAAHATDLPAMVQKAKPAVVEILTYDQQNKLLKTGTGFFISPDGELLTNYHVISDGSSIMAKMPTGAVYFLKSVITVSESNDVAKLQFFATDVPYLTLGSSLSAAEGQRVLVIGNPEGLEGTVSDGIISAFRAGRTMIQITAPVSPGSSGSPVLDESGTVIGIATQVWKEGQNLNFAISAETIRDAIAKSSVVTPSPTPLVAVTPTPNVVGEYLNRALQDGNNGNYQGAIADYTEAIRLQPDNSLFYVFRGERYNSLRQYDKAISDFTESIRLLPTSPTYYDRGNSYFCLKQYRKAISDYTEAIRVDPPLEANPVSVNFRGEVYNMRGAAFYYLKQYSKALGDYRRALSYFTESIRLQPDWAEHYENRANAYDNLGKSSEAAQDRKKAKELRGR
jgi:Flp pilus assembly protein TadD